MNSVTLTENALNAPLMVTEAGLISASAVKKAAPRKTPAGERKGGSAAQLADKLAKVEPAENDVVAHFVSLPVAMKPKKPTRTVKPVKTVKPVVETAKTSNEPWADKRVRSKARRVFGKAKVSNPTFAMIDLYIDAMLAKGMNPRTQSSRVIAKEIGSKK